ncbi:hypothetical protein BT96DRAFT_182396 [Gymnopus androsaceus JB14]|uniref:Uncharacterized protein n=1 Tax=Gymnopus androsaceus JB14 TaxID=1447944 RepID=A0A6A4H8V2_9AGAR|nr:hypothetical protein BT96DRAFT_182396 [Gymnopus androsaceus JB14]
MKSRLCNRFCCTFSLTKVFLSTFLTFPAVAQTEFKYIDDQNGDSATGEVPVFGPDSGWTQGSTCTGCAFHPDVEQAFQGTWQDATHHTTDVDPRTVQFNFTGTSLDVYCIIPNDADLSITSTYDLIFSLDEQPLQQTFTHSSDLSNLFIHNVSVLSLTGLVQVPHTFTMKASSPTVNTTLLFDYARYSVNLAPVSSSSASAFESSTTIAASPSSSIATATPALNAPHTSLSIIICSVLGSILLVLISSVLIFAYRRRRFITTPLPTFQRPGVIQDPPPPYSTF